METATVADWETVGVLVPLAVLVAAAAVAGGARLVHRFRPSRRPMPGLEPGVVLFTSQRCPGCDPVRSKMIEVLGPDGFREIKWTEDPEPFVTHRIGRVPTTVAVDEGGVGHLWEGMPPARLLEKWKSFVYLR